MLTRCVYNGGPDCLRQGGSGCSHHGPGYIHKHVGPKEIGYAPWTGEVTPEHSGEFLCLNLPEVDPDFSKALKDSYLLDDLKLKKSILEFDLFSKEGISSFLILLPILDTQVLKNAYAIIWPGSSAETMNTVDIISEIRGFFLDKLED